MSLTPAQAMVLIPATAWDNPIIAQINAEMRNHQAAEATAKAFAEFLENMKRMTQTLSDENAQLKKSLAAAEQQKKELTALHEADKKASKVQLETIQKEKEAVSKENEALKKERDTLKDSNQSLSNSVSSLSSSLSNANTQNANLQKQNQIVGTMSLIAMMRK